MAIVTRKNKSDGAIRYQVKVLGPAGWINGGTYGDKLVAEGVDNDLKKKARKVDVILSLEDGKKTTVSEYHEVWTNDRKGRVSEGWQISLTQMFKDYVDFPIGKLKMADVAAPHITRLIQSVSEKRSPKMARHVYSLVNTMFNDAVELYGMLERSPVNAKYHRPKVPKQVRKFIEPDHAWQLLELARTHDYLGPPLWLQLLAGLRSEAMQGLQFDSIQWGSSQILIKQAWKQKIGKMAPYPKTMDWDHVPMVPELKKYLWDLWLKHQNPQAFVCQGPNGGMLSYETYLRAAKRLCKQAGVTELATHEFRHSCTEIWVQAGANAEDIRRLLNHSSLTTTAGYIHRTEGRLQSIGEKVGLGQLKVIEGGQPSFPQTFPYGKIEPDNESSTG